ncbi:MAG: endo alpha-1,4 polygalactosaminidase [Deltaproteobacteria bacterium]|nr:endo alpha-1,4 polygalactosaminidase [Deltaproteobacteria bacterium]
MNINNERQVPTEPRALARGRSSAWRHTPTAAAAIALFLAPTAFSTACGDEQGSTDAAPDRDDAELADVPNDAPDTLLDAPEDAPDEETAPDTGDVPPDADDGTAVDIWHPSPGTSWQWQLTALPIDQSFDVAMYDIDLFEVPQETIDALHTDGRIVICYFSAGSWEDWRDDAASFPPSSLGNELDGWPDERWLDTRDATVRALMMDRLDLAAAKSCDGVEPDNVDGYANDPGFPLTAATQLDYNRFLATEARARGLSVGLKNDLDQIPDLLADFDWALDEECFQWDECDLLLPFIDAGKAVFQVEYGDAALADTICPQANALDFDTLIKNLDLDAWQIPCRP